MEKFGVYKAITKPETTPIVATPQQALDQALISNLAVLMGKGDNVRPDYIKEIEDLINQGANVNITDVVYTPLMLAFLSDNRPLLKLI